MLVMVNSSFRIVVERVKLWRWLMVNSSWLRVSRVDWLMLLLFRSGSSRDKQLIAVAKSGS